MYPLGQLEFEKCEKEPADAPSSRVLPSTEQFMRLFQHQIHWTKVSIDLQLVMGPALAKAPVRIRALLDGPPPGEAHVIDVDARGNWTLTRHRGGRKKLYPDGGWIG